MNLELLTTRFSRFARSCSRQPIHWSRQGSAVVAASNIRHPSFRPWVVQDEVAQVRTERTPAAQVVMPVDQLVPLLHRVLLRHHLQDKRRQPLQVVPDRRNRVRPVRPHRLLARASLHRHPRLRQRQDAKRLQLLKHAKAGLDPVPAFRREPAEVLADRVAQFATAQPGKQRHRLLDVGDLAARQPLAEERGRLEILYARIHRAASTGLVQAYRATAKGVRQAVFLPLRWRSKRTRNSTPCRETWIIRKRLP